MMRVLVIGASGVLGSRIKSEFDDRGWATIGTSRSLSKPDLVRLDIGNAHDVWQLLNSQPFDVVVNAAGSGVTRGSASTEVMNSVNDVGAGLVAQAIGSLTTPPKLIHLASSTEARSFDEPESEYARSKANGSQRVRRLAREGRCPAVIARLHNVYSSEQIRGRFISDAVDAALSGQGLTLEFPNRVRDFCLIEDVARNVASLVATPLAELEIDVEIGTGIGVTILEAAYSVMDAVGAPRESVRIGIEDHPDSHPREVADPSQPGFMKCETSLKNGLRVVVGGRT